MLLDSFEIGQIVVRRDARIVDENVEGIDLSRRPLDLRSAGHIQGDGRHAFVVV